MTYSNLFIAVLWLSQIYVTIPSDVPFTCLTPFMDTVILNDISCPMTVAQCEFQQEQIFAIVNSFINVETGTGAAPESRVAYIEFDGAGPSVIVGLSESPYNTLPVSASDIDALKTLIMDAANCEDAPQRTSHPNLQDGVRTALTQFKNSNPDTADIRHDEKVVIFSNCRADNIEDICDDKYIEKKMRGADILMVNIGAEFDVDDPYILCLTEYDSQKIFNFDLEIDEENLRYIQHEICEDPTPAPTTDPTTDPTVDYRR